VKLLPGLLLSVGLGPHSDPPPPPNHHHHHHHHTHSTHAPLVGCSKACRQPLRSARSHAPAAAARPGAAGWARGPPPACCAAVTARRCEGPCQLVCWRQSKTQQLHKTPTQPAHIGQEGKECSKLLDAALHVPQEQLAAACCCGARRCRATGEHSVLRSLLLTRALQQQAASSQPAGCHDRWRREHAAPAAVSCCCQLLQSAAAHRT
jgi:hypothetical protein